MELKLAQAEKMIKAAKEKARASGLKMSFVVVDAGGIIVAAARMDGARKFGPRIALGKALASVVIGRTSAETAVLAKDRPQVIAALGEIVGGTLFAAEGAVPILIDGELVGAIGGSGATSAEDLLCAQAGLDAVIKRKN